MRKLALIVLLVSVMVFPVGADFIAPEVPQSGREWMPERTESFGHALAELAGKVLSSIRPDLYEAIRISVSLTAAVVLISILAVSSEKIKSAVELSGCVYISAVLIGSTNSLIRLGADVAAELGEYGKLLLPVMTAAMAAQGSPSSATALYIGTSVFSAFLMGALKRILIPAVSLYMAAAIVCGAMEEGFLKNIKEQLKKFVMWFLKTVLTVFTSYMAITGVVSGSTDAAALKATRTAISAFVPVIGGTLADASESILVGAALMKNAAGIYGIYAILAVFLAPFAQVGIHYLILKTTGMICGMFEARRATALINDFSDAMGILLAATGSICVMLLVSIFCFLKGGAV